MGKETRRMADLIAKYTTIIATFPTSGPGLVIAVLDTLPQILTDINTVSSESATDKKALILSIVNAGIEKLQVEPSLITLLERVVDWQLDKMLVIQDGNLTVEEPAWIVKTVNWIRVQFAKMSCCRRAA